MIPERLTIDGTGETELTVQHLARYDFAKKYVRTKKVLDVACGTGYGTFILKEAGAGQVVGVDLSDEAVAHARENYSSERVTYVVGKAEEVSSLGIFDVAISFETIEHVENPDLMLNELRRALAPGGILIISTPARERGTLADRPKNPYHYREWSTEEFRILLDKYFHVDTVYGQYNFKRWFPCSRMVQRVLFKILFPRYFRSVDSYPLLTEPPAYARFRFDIIYTTVVCTQRNEK